MSNQPSRPFAGRPDGDLVRQAQAGDASAYGELARRHGSVVKAMLRRMGADGALAEDLAQDAFLTGLRKLASLQDRMAFPGWIKKIAARLYIRRWRREARIDLMAETPEPAPDRTGREPGLRLDLEQALGMLSAPQRLCIGLSFGADLTHEEIARLLDTPLGTVKSHVKRGLETLRRHMEPAEPTGSRVHG